MGTLDDTAFDELLDHDPDAALALLASMAGATDERLRELARRLAGRVLVDVARRGVAVQRGVGRLTRQRASRAVGDLDLDASLDEVVRARAASTAPDPDQLAVAAWRRPGTALCLLVDRSGSMHGERLAAAAVAAAATLYRHAEDCSVVAFGDEAVVLVSQGDERPADEVVGDILRLRGHGTTDVGLALRVARQQLLRSTAGRRIAVLLSDCRVTTGGDATPDAAALLDGLELAVIHPADDPEDALALAATVGAKAVPLAGPSSVPAALLAALT